MTPEYTEIMLMLSKLESKVDRLYEILVEDESPMYVNFNPTGITPKEFSQNFLNFNKEGEIVNES